MLRCIDTDSTKSSDALGECIIRTTTEEPILQSQRLFGGVEKLKMHFYFFLCVNTLFNSDWLTPIFYHQPHQYSLSLHKMDDNVTLRGRTHQAAHDW